MLSWLENTSYALWVAESVWGWPLMLTFHSIGMATVVGVVFVAGFRLLGMFDAIPFASLDRLLVLAWIGFCINVFTGFSLLLVSLTTYVTNVPLILKLVLVTLGGIAIWFAQQAIRRDAAQWETSQASSPLGVGVVIAALVVWTATVVTGRLIAYL